MIINIHGPIASGKTTLTSNLRQFLKSGIGFDEPQINNPALELFYKDQFKYSFVSQLSFFNDLTLISILVDELKKNEMYIINDSSQLGNLVFTQLLEKENKLTKKEHDLLIEIAKISHNLYKDKDVHHVVILKPEDEIISQLLKRGRGMELNYSDSEYFKRLSNNYKELFKEACDLMGGVTNLHFIDCSGKNEKEVMQEVLNVLNIKIKVNRIDYSNKKFGII